MFVILVRIFSFKPEYKLSWEKEPEGKLSGNLAIDADEPDAWTIFSIQDGEYVKSGNTFLLSFWIFNNFFEGYHHAPLFKGSRDEMVMSSLNEAGCNIETLKVTTTITIHYLDQVIVVIVFVICKKLY